MRDDGSWDHGGGVMEVKGCGQVPNGLEGELTGLGGCLEVRGEGEEGVHFGSLVSDLSN